jgi:hypothetical protein
MIALVVVALKVIIVLSVNSHVLAHVIKNVKHSAIHHVGHRAKVGAAKAIPVNHRV